MDLAALIYHRQAFLDGQWWLPLTAQLVHLNGAHAASNAAVALVLAVLVRPMASAAHQGCILLVSAVAVALVLVLDVHCTYYAGASGALYGWAAGACAMGLTRTQGVAPSHRRVALLIGVCLAARLGAMQWAGASTSAWGFPVYLPAHWAGALAGLVVGWVLAHREPAAHQHAHSQNGQKADLPSGD